MQQDIQILKQKCNAAMIALVLAKFGEVTPEKARIRNCHVFYSYYYYYY